MNSGSTARSEGGPADIDAPPEYVLGAEGCPPHSFSPPGPPNRVSVDALLAAGPLPLPQHVFLDLAGRGLGKVSELYPLRALEVRIRSRQWAMISSAVAVRPGRSVTNAFGTSPQVSSGEATTAHSRTAGWAAIACSTSIVLMFSPPEMMMSFIRSRSSMEPSGCTTATSPV